MNPFSQSLAWLRYWVMGCLAMEARALTVRFSVANETAKVVSSATVPIPLTRTFIIGASNLTSSELLEVRSVGLRHIQLRSPSGRLIPASPAPPLPFSQEIELHFEGEPLHIRAVAITEVELSVAEITLPSEFLRALSEPSNPDVQRISAYLTREFDLPFRQRLSERPQAPPFAILQELVVRLNGRILDLERRSIPEEAQINGLQLSPETLQLLSQSPDQPAVRPQLNRRFLEEVFRGLLSRPIGIQTGLFLDHQVELPSDRGAFPVSPRNGNPAQASRTDDLRPVAMGFFETLDFETHPTLLHARLQEWSSAIRTNRFESNPRDRKTARLITQELRQRIIDLGELMFRLQSDLFKFGGQTLPPNYPESLNERDRPSLERIEPLFRAILQKYFTLGKTNQSDPAGVADFSRAAGLFGSGLIRRDDPLNNREPDSIHFYLFYLFARLAEKQGLPVEQPRFWSGVRAAFRAEFDEFTHYLPPPPIQSLAAANPDNWNLSRAEQALVGDQIERSRTFWSGGGSLQNPNFFDFCNLSPRPIDEARAPSIALAFPSLGVTQSPTLDLRPYFEDDELWLELTEATGAEAGSRITPRRGQPAAAPRSQTRRVSAVNLDYRNWKSQP